LVAEPAGFSHGGIDLSSKVEGLGELALEEGFRLHPDDLQRLGLNSGDRVTISFEKRSVSAPARADEECPMGVIYFHRPFAFGGLGQRADLEPLYRCATNPLPVSVQAAKGKSKQARRKASAAS